MDFNQQIVDTFRANGGEVNEPMRFGTNLVLVHVPKKDGTERVTPLAAVQQDGAWHVAGSAGGSPRHPAWVFALRRADRLTIEVPGDPVETVPVSVTEVTGPERDAMWERFKQFSSGFAEYEEKAQGRIIPIFRLAA
ncbi:nitroreductase/quinone reductase family protein [Georgenia deserti]|uniref:Nitroreductase/quinone reductase family protein n=1 Tax=Georgenia deserti TaxID=2093781 RepID=A0ABW4LAT4_9MICO